jgi:hypothetical protein
MNAMLEPRIAAVRIHPPRLAGPAEDAAQGEWSMASQGYFKKPSQDVRIYIDWDETQFCLRHA